MSAWRFNGLTASISAPSVPFLAPNGTFPSALTTTIVVEGLIILAYAPARGLRVFRWLRYVVLINLVTQPALWHLMGLLPADIAYFPALTAAESAVWVVETGLLHLLAGDRLGIGHALVLSLVLNVASCGVGLLLPT